MQIDKSRAQLSPEKCCNWHKSAVSWATICWWPEGNVYDRGKLSMVMYAAIKWGAGLPRKFVFLQSSNPDVRREGGGGKTNISLLESSEEWSSVLKTSTIRDGKQKFGEGMKKGMGLTRKLRSILLLAEVLCSEYINCKKRKCLCGCLEREKKFLLRITVSLHIYAEGPEMTWPVHKV